MLRRGLIAGAAALLLAFAPTTSAKPPTGFTVGFSGGADAYLASGNPATDAPWVTRAKAVGAQMIRLDVNWSHVAPTVRPARFVASDPNAPGYQWTALDEQVRELSNDGFQILIDVWGAPAWAESPQRPRSAPPGTWRPSASKLAAFATAIATRYNGRFMDPLKTGAHLPRVTDWQVWNEANLSTYLTPQWVRTPSHHWLAESPIITRALTNSFYDAIKAVSPADLVVLGGTAPYGDQPGGQRIPPVDFDEDLFCLSNKLQRLSCPAPTHFDVLDHHPYGVFGATWHALNPGDVAVPDINKLTRVVHAARMLGTILPNAPKRFWVTEISWDTKPPDPHGVPVNQQARWLEQSLYVLWSQGVDTVLWWQLADAPPIPNYDETYQAGVYYISGQAKPGATAFRLPVVVNRGAGGQLSVWGRAPVAGRLLVQTFSRDRWQTFKSLSVSADQVFELALPSTATACRALLANEVSLDWTVPSHR